MRRRRGSKKAKPKKVCDPAMCDCCQYIGEGDFLCDEHMEIVVSDWEPTGNYLMCQVKRSYTGDGNGDGN